MQPEEAHGNLRAGKEQRWPVHVILQADPRREPLVAQRLACHSLVVRSRCRPQNELLSQFHQLKGVRWQLFGHFRELL